MNSTNQSPTAGPRVITADPGVQPEQEPVAATSLADEVAALRADLDSSFPNWRTFDYRIAKRLDRIAAMASQPAIDSTTGEPLWLCACGDVLPGSSGPQQCVTGCGYGWQPLYVIGGAA